MKIIGTNDEITYIMLQCQNSKAPCEECVLYKFCNKDMFMRMNPAKLNAIETGKYESILISKGDDKNASGIS